MMMQGAKALGSGSNRFFAGFISAQIEDAEGGIYTADEMDLAALVRDGYLDVHHLMFERGIEDAVIGEPVEVRPVRGGVWAKFKVAPSQLAHDLWQYVMEHPGLLGFSIAGGLLKPLFERGGRWMFEKARSGSVALTRFPMNAGTAAFAGSGALAASATLATEGGLLRIMRGLVVDLAERRLSPRADMDGWYRYFAGTGLDALDAAVLSGWASTYFGSAAEAVDQIEAIRGIIIVPEDETDAVRSELRWRMTAWLATHPRDPHFSGSGKFRTIEDATTCIHHCWRLSPQQTARILGYVRGSGADEFIAYLPATWKEAPVA